MKVFAPLPDTQAAIASRCFDRLACLVHLFSIAGVPSEATPGIASAASSVRVPSDGFRREEHVIAREGALSHAVQLFIVGHQLRELALLLFRK